MIGSFAELKSSLIPFECPVKGGTVTGFRTGGDKPPLVLFHGVGDNGLCWLRTAGELKGEFDVIMPDARGHGRTRVITDEPFGPEALAHDAAQMIRGLDLDAPLSVMGHSMGAEEAAVLAADYPLLVSRAVLIDPPLLSGFRGWVFSRVNILFLRQTVRLGRQRNADELKALCVRKNPAWSDLDAEAWAHALTEFSYNAGKKRSSEYKCVKSWNSLFRKTKAPLLMITGEKGILNPRQAGKSLKGALSAKIKHLSGTGHNIQREAYDEYIRAFRAFVTAGA